LSNSRRGGGSGAGGGGGVSSQWVEEHFVNKEFFSAIFKIFNGTGSSATEIEPNDTDTIEANPNTVNIEAMFGLWTEKYMSALGLNDSSGGGGGGGASYLSQLLDVFISGATSGQALIFNGQKWTNQSIPSSGGTVISVGMSVPTGLKVSGGNSQNITTSGTFVLTFDTGYSIPTIAKQSNWDGAYTWVNNNGAATVEKTAWGKKYWESGAPQNISGDMSSVGDITFQNGDRKLKFDSNDNFHIRKISDRFIIKANGTAVINIYNNKFYCTTQIHTTVGLLSDNYVSALSDIRYKNVVKKFSLSIDEIASASLILFTWKGRDDNRHHAGVIAQEWQKILPEAVVEGEDGKLGVDYGVIGAASAVSLARKVKEQQQEIDTLKKKNDELEKRLARLEKMFAITDED
jgi:hypothetical protein